MLGFHVGGDTFFRGAQSDVIVFFCLHGKKMDDERLLCS